MIIETITVSARPAQLEHCCQCARARAAKTRAKSRDHFAQSQLAPRREVPGSMDARSIHLIIYARSQSSRADIFLPCWKRGRPAGLDVTVISSLQQSTVLGAANNQGHALNVRARAKSCDHFSSFSSIKCACVISSNSEGIEKAQHIFCQNSKI